ncbi:ADCY10 [Symbiodinium sp. CCMP2592]|nr:ADCY10 [Symbiodinium sp. CCMP2592]
MLPLPCPCVEWLWNRREALPAQPRANGDGRRKATTVSIAPEDVPEEQVPAEDMHSAPARRPTRDYSKLTSFVRDDTDELDGTDTWRYYALVAEKEVENSTRKLVEAQQAEGSEAAPQPSLTPTRRSVVRRPQLLQNSMLQYLSHTVCDAIEQGIICKEDFPRAILEDKHSKYNASKGRFEAVVVFMDASGFTALTESLARQAHGAEEIGSCLNNFFGALIEIITRHGGDVLKFSGDALTILWRVEDEGVPWRSRSPSKSTNSSCTLPPVSKADATSRQLIMLVEEAVVPIPGLYCKYHLQSELDFRGAWKVGAKKSRSSFGATPVPGVVLTLHIGVGFGPLTLLQLGGVLDRWEFCAAGQPLEVAIAEPLAHSGETVVSSSVQEVLASKGQSSEFCFEAGFPEQPGYALLTSTAAPLGSGKVLNAILDGGAQTANSAQLVEVGDTLEVFVAGQILSHPADVVSQSPGQTECSLMAAETATPHWLQEAAMNLVRGISRLIPEERHGLPGTQASGGLQNDTTAWGTYDVLQLPSRHVNGEPTDLAAHPQRKRRKDPTTVTGDEETWRSTSMSRACDRGTNNQRLAQLHDSPHGALR